MLPALEWSRGDRIEVQIPDPGFEQSFFPAVFIARFLPDNYLVQYSTLLTEDETEYLREMVPISCVRSVPLQIPVQKWFTDDDVDAWTRDGWWKGKVLRTVGQMVEVHFSTGEVQLFTDDYIRVHQRWRKREDVWVMKKKRREEEEDVWVMKKKRMCG